MTFTQKQLISLLVAGIVVIGILLAQVFQNPNKAIGSIDTDTGGYRATTTDAAMGTGLKVLKSTSGVFGSVVVTLGSTGGIRIYDATTTAAYVYGASSTIAMFPTTATAGTYTYDVTATRGIVIEVLSTAGIASTTLTWK